MGKKISIKLIRSPIGRPKKHKLIIKGLGLSRPNKSVIREDTPQIRGMINKISHLVEVREVSA